MPASEEVYVVRQPRNDSRTGRLLMRSTALVCLFALLFCFGGCSDQVLVEDTKPSPSVTHDPSQGEELTIYFETEPETGFIIGGDDPTDLFAGAAHLMRAEFLDTGKSDCLLLRLDDTVILVDAADSDDYAHISRKLTSYGISTIDYFIITHYDNDHIGSAAQVLQNFTVKTVYMPDYVRDSHLYRTLADCLSLMSDRVSVHRLTEDVTVQLPYGSLWINPTRLYQNGITLGSDADNHTAEENNFSLITSVYFGDVSLLLLGDAERERMEEFYALFADGSRGAFDYNLVKTPHHGESDKGLLAALSALTAAKPRYCVVCVDDPAYVDSALVTKMQSIPAGAYYTSGGDVTFTTDGNGMVVTQ